jgi:hypothetical protein
VHLNGQNQFPGELRYLPMGAADAALTFANEGEEFVMTLGEKVFSQKSARTRRQLGRWPAPCCHGATYNHAAFNRSEILSRGKPAAPVPNLFIRWVGTYSAHLNAGNPIGSMQSTHRYNIPVDES